MGHTFYDSFRGARCLIYGMGVSNAALTEYLFAEGAEIIAFDKKSPHGKALETAERCCKETYFGKDYEKEVMGDFVFRSPGIKPSSNEIVRAVGLGAVLSSEVELFFDRAPCKIYGVTGSDGKTTTTTLIYEILKRNFFASGKKVYVGGNIGIPLILFINELKEDDVVVAELSSFQLMTMKKSPSVGAVTNITQNHLDYHSDMGEYIDAKCNIFSQGGCEKLVLRNDFYGREIAKKASDTAEIFFVSPYERTGGKNEIYLENGFICCDGAKEKQIVDTREILIPGAHNVENYMTAAAMTLDTANISDIRDIAKKFKGVRHRIELVREFHGVKYYNSSIDSTPSRSIATIKCFKEPLTVLCGGYDKNLDFGGFAQCLNDHASNVVLAGANREKILKEIHALENPKFKVYEEPDFRAAVILAKNIAKSGEAVILSPASASFDSFANFEERGEVFCNIVNSF